MTLTDAEVLKFCREACAAPRPEQFTDRNHCCECADHDDLLRSRDLDSLTVADVGNPGWDPICFVTDYAFFYYLPALARLALDPPDEKQDWYLPQLLFHLTYEGAANRRLLTASHRYKQAVLLLLGHVRDTRADLVQQEGCAKDLEAAFALWRS